MACAVSVLGCKSKLSRWKYDFGLTFVTCWRDCHNDYHISFYLNFFLPPKNSILNLKKKDKPSTDNSIMYWNYIREIFFLSQARSFLLIFIGLFVYLQTHTRSLHANNKFLFLARLSSIFIQDFLSWLVYIYRLSAAETFI